LAEYDEIIRGPPFLALPRAPPTLSPPLAVSVPGSAVKYVVSINLVFAPYQDPLSGKNAPLCPAWMIPVRPLFLVACIDFIGA